jgi:anti-sigma factor RsiW
LDCRRAEQSLGVLVLGALAPSDRDEIEEHVRACQGCRTQLAELAALPGLLKRVDPTLIDPSPAPPAILDRALAQIRAGEARDLTPVRRLRRPRFAAVLAVAAFGAILVAVFFGARTFAGLGATSPASVVAAAQNAATGVSATVTLQPSPAGTQVLLALSGVSPGARCQLVAVGKGGQREVTSTWVASYEGQAQVAGTTGMPVDQIASFDVTTLRGSTLVSVPVPA